MLAQVNYLSSLFTAQLLLDVFKKLAAPQGAGANMIVTSSSWRKYTVHRKWHHVRSLHDIQSEKLKAWETGFPRNKHTNFGCCTNKSSFVTLPTTVSKEVRDTIFFF